MNHLTSIYASHLNCVQTDGKISINESKRCEIADREICEQCEQQILIQTSSPLNS